MIWLEKNRLWLDDLVFRFEGPKKNRGRRFGWRRTYAGWKRGRRRRTDGGK